MWKWELPGEGRKWRRQKEILRTGSLPCAPSEEGQVSEQDWKGKQKKGEERQGEEEAWLWVEPLETLPVCKKDKIKPAGQLQMLLERRKKTKHVKGKSFRGENSMLYLGQYLKNLKKEHTNT